MKSISTVEFGKVVDYLIDKRYVTNQRALAEILGVHEQSLTEYKSGRRKKLKPGLIEIIETRFPEISIEKVLNADSEHLGGIVEKGIPYFDMEVSAGPVEMFQDVNESQYNRIFIPGYTDCDFSINVWGDSMYPAYKNGDIIMCREMQDKSIILFGNAYLVITKELRTLKFVQKGTTKDKVILRSDNDKFDDVEIARDAILKLYLVKGKITRDAI